MAVVIPLNNPLGPADDTVTATLCSTSTSTRTLWHGCTDALAIFSKHRVGTEL